MTRLNNEIRELTTLDLETVAGGGWLDAAFGALGNAIYDVIKKESDNGAIAKLIQYQASPSPNKLGNDLCCEVTGELTRADRNGRISKRSSSHRKVSSPPDNR